MFKPLFPGIRTWWISDKLYINYIKPQKDIPIVSQIHEETIIYINHIAFVFNGDLREELLQTGGDLDKLSEWYDDNVLFDTKCHAPHVANSLKEIFNRELKKATPRKRK